MSYMSGIMMGMAFGKGMRNFFKGCKKKTTPTFSVASSLPGRRRYYINALKGNPEVTSLLESRLSEVDFISSAKANAATGSLLIYHTDENSMDAFEETLRSYTDTTLYSANNTRLKRLTPPPQAGASAARSIRSCASSLNQFVHSRTGGVFDFATLAAFFFIARGFSKCVTRAQWPVGPQMVWWGISLLRDRGLL